MYCGFASCGLSTRCGAQRIVPICLGKRDFFDYRKIGENRNLLLEKIVITQGFIEISDYPIPIGAEHWPYLRDTASKPR